MIIYRFSKSNLKSNLVSVFQQGERIMIFRISLMLCTGIFLSGLMTITVDAGPFADLLQEASKVYTKAKEEVEKSRKKDEEMVGTKRTQSQNKVVSPVPEVQELLNKLGYDAGPVDGALKEKTKSAIKAFKRDNKMHVDGLITESLILALRKVSKTKQGYNETKKRGPSEDQNSPSQQSGSEHFQDVVPITKRYMRFLTLREHPQLREADDSYFLWQIERQILYEQEQWREIDRILAQWQKNPTHTIFENGKRTGKAVNRKRPAFIYEWQKLVNDRPALAYGPLLDLFWQPDPDWSFLQQERDWDDQLVALAEVFIFSREKIEGREPKFVAKDLLHVWKQHRKAVFARQPQRGRMYISEFFKNCMYDFDTQSLKLMPEAGYNSVLFNPRRKMKSGKLSFLYTLPSSFFREEFPGKIRKTNRIPNIIFKSRPNRWIDKIDKNSIDTYPKYQLLEHKNTLVLDHRLGPASIPMNQSKAEALIKKLKKITGTYKIEARLTIKPIRTEISIEKNRYDKRKYNSVFPTLIGDMVSVEFLTATGEVVASFGPDNFPTTVDGDRLVQSSAPLSSSDKAEPINPFYITLFALREHPEMVEKYCSVDFVKKQILSEQRMWKYVNYYLEEKKKNYSKIDAVFTYEWETLEKERSSFANGPVLDTFWQQKPDWSFVKQEKEWFDGSRSAVCVFIFSRKNIEGRNPDFAARDLLPIWKRHLNAVLKKVSLPKQLLLSGHLYPKYDFNTQKLQLIPHYKVESRSDRSNKISVKQEYKDISDLFAPIINRAEFSVSLKGNRSYSGKKILLTHSTLDSSLYWLFNKEYYDYFNTPLYLSDTWFGSDFSKDNPVSTWRSRFYTSYSFYSNRNKSPMHNARVLALDRRLTLDSIPMPAKEAEELLKKIQGEIEARLSFEPIRVEMGTWVGNSNKQSKPLLILFGRVNHVDLLTNSGKLIASFEPDKFPFTVAKKADTSSNTIDKEARKEKIVTESTPVDLQKQEGTPDILGIKLGMQMSEAEKVIRKHMDVSRVYRFETKQENRVISYPFAQIFESENGNEAIVLYTLPAYTDKVLAALRSIRIDQYVDKESLVKALKEKYGKPAEENKARGNMQWGKSGESKWCGILGLKPIIRNEIVLTEGSQPDKKNHASGKTDVPNSIFKGEYGQKAFEKYNQYSETIFRNLLTLPLSQPSDTKNFEQCGTRVHAYFNSNVLSVCLFNHSQAMRYFLKAYEDGISKKPKIDIKF